ncbi:MAG: EAL domain-containing protein [Gammaproteobacteria bacterium]
MFEAADRIGQRFPFWLFLGYLFTALAGFGLAGLFGIFDAAQLETLLAQGVVPAAGLLFVFWTLFSFQRFITPFTQWLQQHPQGGHAPDYLHRRLQGFSVKFWRHHLLYVLASPLVTWYALSLLGQSLDINSLIQFTLLQLAAAILVGMPSYLYGLNQLGNIAELIVLELVHVRLKTRMLMLTGIIPVTANLLLAGYFWLTAPTANNTALAIPLALIGISVIISWQAVKSIRQALEPFRDLLDRSGASSHANLSKLRPASIDEIGHLTQTLGKVFRRLGDKETHMRAIVDTAAEGIIVINNKGIIDTFNPAAERLFGYLVQEIQGRHMSLLLPDQFETQQTIKPHIEEQEIEAKHRNGSLINVSLRISEMIISNRRMFTCLVGDISLRKSTENELIAADLRYRDLVETAHDLVWSIDNNGCWSYVNNSCKQIYGLQPEEMLGRPVTDFSALGHAEQDQLALSGLLDNEDLYQYETVHVDNDGKQHNLSFNARCHLNEAGEIVNISGTARDITDQKVFHKKLTYQAEHDTLTHLFNRHYFQQELERTMARVARRPDATCALLYIDLDQFKYINDTLGHAAGDRLLIEATQLLQNHVREGDLLARFGGDEFTLLLYNISSSDTLQAADHFRQLFENYTFIEGGKSFNITCSIGIAIIDTSVIDAEEALSHADLACNMAKAQGRNRCKRYDPSDSKKAGMAEDMGWASRVREMLDQDRFHLVYQPIMSLADDQVHDYEVLVRMRCDDGEIILPGGFMPAAERFGLIHSVDRWIVRHALEHLGKLHQRNEPVCFAINLSGKAFEDEELLPLIQDLLDTCGVQPDKVCFEITETSAISNLSAAEQFISSLKTLGCQFALDDFGSGFSSFTYLKHLPIDKLKIDGSFVQGMAHSSVDQAMVRSMNQVAHALGKVTVAEYVENSTTLRLLRNIGVDYVQGNYVGKPREALINIARPADQTLKNIAPAGR